MSSLPDKSKAEIDFLDTSFFRSDKPDPPQLPAPGAILEQYPDLEGGVVKYENLNLAVKFGESTYVRLEEAQTMRAVRHAFLNDEVPVPEVFGWRKYGEKNFIYISLIHGETLREAWPKLTEADKESICDGLAHIVSALRQVSQGSSDTIIGSVSRGTVQDRFFQVDYEDGPFTSIKSFNDWLFAAATRTRPGPEGVTGPYRDLLSDTGPIYFTHGDLTLGNIIVSSMANPRRILGVVDWEQAGWYPAYWEYCKLLYGVEYSHEWRSEGWAEKVMEQYTDEWFAFAEYSLWRCP
ncbi:putative Kinase-like domain-containing protein [Seiridium cardinale]|uniref:Kinase-like domain-containing protein n=1 Tax=Seiridium cardinale TaxID=138064 RepID=A0ABR2Y8N1_9PEZI